MPSGLLEFENPSWSVVSGANRVMHYQEAERAYGALRMSLDSGKLSPEAFSTQVNALRVQGPDGAWWQINPQDGTWLRWDGSRWLPGVRPAPVAAAVEQPPPLPGAFDPPPLPAQALAMKSLGPFRRFILARSERWWDFFSICGGAAGAGLWYWYSQLDVADKRTPWMILGIPVAIVIFRKLIDGVLAPIHRVIGRFLPRLVRIGAGLAMPAFLASRFYGKIQGSNYEFRYMQHVLVWSVVLSYILIRQPGGAKAITPGPVAPAPRADLPQFRIN